MKRLLGRAATGGIVAVGATAMFLAGPVAGVASAASAPTKHAAPAPTTKVPGTNCTLRQVEKAIAKEDPALWKKIESNPKAKQRFEERIVKSWNHPKGAHPKQKPHPKAHPKKDHKKLTPQQRAERRAQMLALKAKVTATCGKY